MKLKRPIFSLFLFFFFSLLMVFYFNCGKGFQSNFEDELSGSETFQSHYLLDENFSYTTDLSNEDLVTLVNKTKNKQIDYYTGFYSSNGFAFEHSEGKQNEQLILLAFLENSHCLSQDINLILNDTIVSNDLIFDGILESNDGCWGTFFLNSNESHLLKSASIDSLLMFSFNSDRHQFVVKNLDEITNLYLVPVNSLETNSTATPIPNPTSVPTSFPTSLPTVTPVATVYPTPIPTAYPIPNPTSTPVIQPTPSPKPVLIQTPTPAPTTIVNPCDQIQFSHYQLFDRNSQKLGSLVSQNEVLKIDKNNSFEIHIVFKDNNLIKSTKTFTNNNEHIENSAPWQAKIFDLSEGKHVIKTTPYLDSNAQGLACSAQTLNFSIQYSQVVIDDNKPDPTPETSSTLPYNGKYFGVLKTGSQGNIQVKNLNATGFRFKSRYDSLLESVTVHVKAATYKTVAKCSETNCYGGGNGGNLQAFIYADNGKGFPDLSKKLGATNKIVSVIKTWGESDLARSFKFTVPINLSVNKRYHVLFSNDASSSGWSSVNWQFSYANPINVNEPVSPYWSDEVVWKGTSLSPRHQPAFRLTLKVNNNTIQWGSVDIMARPGVLNDPNKNDTVRSICGQNKVRQRFRPDRDMIVKGVILPFAYFGSGTGDLTLRITDESSNVISSKAQTSFNRSLGLNIGSKFQNIFTNKDTAGKYVLRFKSASFEAPIKLQAKKNYYLEAFNSSSGPCYFMMANENTFRDGYDTEKGNEAWNDQAEYSNDGSWNLMYIWKKARPTMEWPMALELEQN